MSSSQYLFVFFWYVTFVWFSWVKNRKYLLRLICQFVIFYFISISVTTNYSRITKQLTKNVEVTEGKIQVEKNSTSTPLWTRIAKNCKLSSH
jgi:hypothetical protein